MRHFNENYVVTECGELFSLFHHKLRKLKPYLNSGGYLVYRLRINGVTKHFTAHHLSYFVNVGEFDTSDGLCIDHIDGNKLNNHYTNLRRVTWKDNANNINTAGDLPYKSRSGYRIMPTDCLPKVYEKKAKFDEKELFVSRCKDYCKYTTKRKSCSLCGSLTSGNLCLSCFKERKSSGIPPREQLEKELFTGEPLTKLCLTYGISDNAYRKWLKKRGLPFKRKDIINYFTSV